MIGRMAGTTLRARKRISYRNSFQVFITARLVAEGAGTRVSCRFGMHPFVKVFMIVWFGGVLSAGVGIFSGSVAELMSEGLAAPQGTWLGVAGPLGMMLFGVALVGLGRLLGQSERRFLLDFVCTTLDTNPAGSP